MKFESKKNPENKGSIFLEEHDVVTDKDIDKYHYDKY